MDNTVLEAVVCLERAIRAGGLHSIGSSSLFRESDSRFHTQLGASGACCTQILRTHNLNKAKALTAIRTQESTASV